MSTCLVRLVTGIVVLAAATAVAVAGPEDGVRKRIEDALLAGDKEAAVAVVDSVVERAGDASMEELVGTSRATFELLPHEIGSPRAAALLGTALKRDKTQEPAWTLAYQLLERLIEDLDIGVGEPFARLLTSIHQGDAYTARRLGALQVRCGHSDDARATFESLLGVAPSDVETLYELAELEDRLGNDDRALEHYARLIELRGDLRARYTRASILAKPTVRRFDDALVAIAQTLEVARKTPAGETRDWYLQRLERLRSQVDDSVEQRDGLVALDMRLDRLLWSLGGIWVVFLGGAVAFLRRQRLI